MSKAWACGTPGAKAQEAVTSTSSIYTGTWSQVDDG